MRDWIGRWLVNHGMERLADHFALMVMGRQARPAERYLPLWRERWTRREEAPPAGTPGADLEPRITADCGAMRLLEQLGRAGEARPSYPS